uniref:NADH dehydrogenase subunit 6 n=1 Tax=Pulvinaster venetus TaxID=427767 RepID=UPI001FCDF97E|nr:NADH dehydrogenase subunit 6 [Pulvinaster venetus]UNJ18967.1 NADH dehydrogenase subunit 6 [Pulvinaster venetus]
MIFHLIFYYFSSFCIICSLMVILSNNPVHSVLFLILTFCNVAGLLFLLGAEFLALMFIIIYVGAISVLFLFVVMMLNIRIKQKRKYSVILPLGFFISFILLFQLLLLLDIDFIFLKSLNYNIKFFKKFYIIWYDIIYTLTNIEIIGFILYIECSYLFIVCSLILLVAMIGAIVLTLHQRTDIKKQDLGLQLSRRFVGIIRFSKTTVF